MKISNTEITIQDNFEANFRTREDVPSGKPFLHPYPHGYCKNTKLFLLGLFGNKENPAEVYHFVFGQYFFHQIESIRFITNEPKVLSKTHKKSKEETWYSKVLLTLNNGQQMFGWITVNDFPNAL